MKKLVLAEKPSVGRDIARVLNCGKEKNGYFENDNYIVTWALGHLVTLADPESYNEKYKAWNIEDLPIIPKNFKLITIKKTSKQFNTVKSLMNKEYVNEIIIATDAGREGELVARWIIEKSNIKKNIKRLWISSVTDKAIKDGFNNLKPGKQYENLYYSAIARAEADWIVGINATRALTTKHNAQLSCGRVQTPTLNIINKREEEIRNFVPKDYYGITIQSKEIKFTWVDNKSNSQNSFNEEKIDKIIQNIKNKDAKITEIKTVSKKTHSKPLYDLTELQRDANKIFGYSAKETLSIMQKLYEYHKVLTYPRTDSRYISSDIVDTLKDRIKACSVGEYSRIGVKLLKSKLNINKNFVDDNKVSDHHAIIPTEENIFLSDLSDKERKIYDLVVKRFFAVLYPPFEYQQITAKATIENESFIAKGKKVTQKGWMEIYKDMDDEDDLLDQNIDFVKKDQKLEIINIKKTANKTTPPSFLNEASLLTAMEKSNLGTVATRADIIEKLFNGFLVEKRTKDIFVTSKGKQLLELVPSDLKSEDLTSTWESKLTDISKGKLKKDVFIDEMKNYSKEVVVDIKNSESKFKHDNITKNKCPECGKYMLEVNGKKGKMLVCEDRECNTRKTISQTTNSRCPNCHKKLELKGEGENRIFVCKCGHREKMSSFKKRKETEKSKASKKDVNKYLKNQNKNEEPLNNAFAAAFAKLQQSKK